jgi:signal transduction histidine kinase/sensor domain CHASE-containing protein
VTNLKSNNQRENRIDFAAALSVIRRRCHAVVGDTLLARMLTVYAAAIAVLALASSAAVIFVVWPNYQDLERRESQHRENAVLQALRSEKDRLEDLTNTYGVWDTPFDYIVGINSAQRFPETDLNPKALDQIEIDGAFITRNDGLPLFEGRSAEGSTAQNLLPFVIDAFTNAPDLQLEASQSAKTAILVLGDEAVLISVRRVVRSDGSGDSPGVIGLARVVGPDVLSRMKALTGVEFEIKVADPSIGVTETSTDRDVRAQTMLPDAWGRPVVRIDVIGSSEVLNLGRATITMMAATMLIAVGIIGVGFAILLAGAVVQPVTSLIRSVNALSRGETTVSSKRRPPLEIRELETAFRSAFLNSRRETELHRAARNEAVAARATAEHANQTKSRFLATMTHELRTPLNAIIGYSEIIQEDARDAGRVSHVTDLGKVLTAARGLLALINSVLDFSKLESEHFSLVAEPLDVASLVHETAMLVRPTIEAKDIEFSVMVENELGVATSDAMRIRQSLSNLLSNAAKFTESGSISFRASRRTGSGGDWLIFAVQDTGIGMTDEQLKRVFEPFTQADDSITRRFGGTGLGLSITHDLISRMGGTIDVKTTPGEGTRFVVRLPAVVNLAHTTTANLAA